MEIMKVNIPIQGTIQSKLNWLIEYPTQLRFEFFLISFDLNSQGDSISQWKNNYKPKVNLFGSEILKIHCCSEFTFSTNFLMNSEMDGIHKLVYQNKYMFSFIFHNIFEVVLHRMECKSN